MDTSSILPILKQIPLFQELNEIDHKEVIPHIVMNYYPANHVLFSQGDVGDKMYIIKSGMVKISRKDENGPDIEIATLTPTDFFGEMALISDEPRNATATVVEEGEIFELAKRDFFALIEKTPGLATKISTEFIVRIKSNNKTVNI
ncbi:MAG: transcriptional regulator of Crp/Fnr family [Candidatus Peregrinibacteria bacterium GW2011_GWA2_47_7]|nr:MAG: transcriptional regulator of Crp/Fnr family [Candidatus Peregrinibacteria bacterium GW2011_GWA2_47_7]